MTSLILIYVIVSLVVYIRLNVKPPFDAAGAFRAACWPMTVICWMANKCDEMSRKNEDRDNG